ncbi:MAG TPA: nickel-dependent lactate racemase [Pyrinomonadaceae bacterium]|nr:nickel-dependent lactate racemase [Pyrinomonadaceae bacterium]
MAQIQLGYGKDSLSLKFDETRFQVLSGNSLEESPLSDFKIGEALSNPIGSPPIDDLFSSSDSVLIVVSDATRATASAQIINLLVRRLIQAGVSPAEIAIIFATGIHRRVSAEEKIELLTPFIAQRIRILDHDANDSSAMLSLGTTQSGTPVEVNRALRDYSGVIITGAIGFHYFAGFTGGRKSICPGLASAKTIEATHMLALDFETGGRRAGVNTALLQGNAVHEECERIAAMIQPGLGVYAVVDERGRAVGVYAGDWRVAHETGCREYHAGHSMQIDAKREVTIVSCGGSPYDVNMIQAHKALDMAAHACLKGGDIILLAECPDGLGRSDFLKWFDAKDSQELARRLCKDYEVNGQTAWALLSKAERYQIQLVSRLPEEKVHRMRMRPARSLNEAVESLRGGANGYIMPRGAAVLPEVN